MTAHDISIEGRIIRKLRIGDLDTFRAHLLRLDPPTRRLRFGMAASDQFLQDYAERAFSINTVIVGCFMDGALRGSGELRFLFDVWPVAAEAAFAVEGPWQNRGIGRALMARIVAIARNRSVSTVHMICLAENRHMRHLVQTFEGVMHAEAGQTRAILERKPATAASIAEELLDDGGAFVRAQLAV
jgi:GNAT superfamily N-acetyltransferase